MPLFALPIAASTQSSTSRINLNRSISLPTRKRKRHPSPSPPPFELSRNEADDFHAASTNPLSLAPGEISQYRLAGLSINEELPNRNGVDDFPHRGLPREKEFFAPPSPEIKIRDIKRKGKGKHKKQDEEDEDDGRETRPSSAVEERPPRGHMLRIRHFSVLTAILHKNLLDGDIPRATRAYSLLLRAEFGGKAVDIKSTGYWAIGAELLVRSLDRRRKRNILYYAPDYDSESELEEAPETGEEQATNQADMIDGERRWGTAAGLSKAKSFYETLILQYPYKKQYHDYASALDVWPAMAACEVYGIQYEHRSALQKLNSSSSRYSSPDESADERGTSDDEEGYQMGSSRRNRTRRRRERVERVWPQKDNIRLDALTAAESLASRMDEALNRTPFDRSHEMLHLRGMLALYIGDLSVPEMPDSAPGDEDGRDIERRLLYRDLAGNYELGKEKKSREWARARAFFESSTRNGGDEVLFDEHANTGVDVDMDMDEEEDQDDLYDAD